MSSIEILVKDEKISDGSDLRGKIKDIIEANRNLKGALIRILQSAQSLYGYLPSQVLTIISDEMKVPLSEVSGIVSFYSFFSTVPKGDHVIQVCMGTSCYVKGGQRILDTLKKDYGLESGGTTSDKKFSLETVRCLGCCGLSPVVAVGEDIYRRVKPGKIGNILSSYK